MKSCWNSAGLSIDNWNNKSVWSGSQWSACQGGKLDQDQFNWPKKRQIQIHRKRQRKIKYEVWSGSQWGLLAVVENWTRINSIPELITAHTRKVAQQIQLRPQEKWKQGWRNNIIRFWPNSKSGIRKYTQARFPFPSFSSLKFQIISSFPLVRYFGWNVFFAWDFRLVSSNLN